MLVVAKYIKGSCLPAAFRLDEAALKLINVLNAAPGSVWYFTPNQLQPANLPGILIQVFKIIQWEYCIWEMLGNSAGLYTLLYQQIAYTF